MFKGVTRLSFLIMLGASVNVVQADLSGQLSALQGRLGALKAKLGELRDALQDLKIKLEEAGKEEAINQLVQEKAFDSFMKKISPHLNDKGFVGNIVKAFKKNGYEAFNQIAQLFPKNQLNEELNQIKELFVNVYESFVDQDLTNKKFVNAEEKASKLSVLEIRYNDSSLKKEKKEIIDEIVSNSNALSIEQLEKVSGALNSDREKKLFIHLVTKALTEPCLSQDDREELAKELMMSLSSSKPDEQISKIKDIIGKDGLVDFYKNGAKNLLMNGLKGAKVKYSGKASMMYNGVNIMPATPAKRIFSGYTNFNDLVEKLEAGLKQPHLSEQANQKIFETLSVDGIPCENLYEAFAQPAEHLRLLEEFLKNKLLVPDENNKSLAQRLLTIIMGPVSSEWDDDNDDDDALVFKIPHWFNIIFKNDAIKKEALIDIITKSLDTESLDTDGELKVFKKKFDKLMKLEQAIKDILFGGKTGVKVNDFWNKKPSKAEELKKKIKDAQDADEKAAKEEAKKIAKTGGFGDTGLMKNLVDALKALRGQISPDFK